MTGKRIFAIALCMSLVLTPLQTFAESADGNSAADQVEYKTDDQSAYDYENSFSSGEDISAFEAWGTKMDSDSGGKYGFTLSVVPDDDENSYLHADIEKKNGDRGSRVNISDEIMKGAEVQFDWRPVSTNRANGQIMFLSPEKWHPYFTLRFDGEGNISAYTENSLQNCSTSQNEFVGSISEDEALDTGLGGMNKWFTVNVRFDYLNHTADITVTDKENAENTFTQKEIPIETEANGLQHFVIHGDVLNNSAAVAMDLDNLTVAFDKFGASDIVAVQQPEDITVAKEAFNEDMFPSEITAILGDGSEVRIEVGDWTAEPEFDENTEAVYTWTAPLITGDLTNHFALEASFEMEYTLYPFPLYVHNPNTVELEFGEAMPAEFPKEVTAFMSDGTTGTVEVGEWVPIRAFNAEEEGIYVYGANVIPTEGEISIKRDRLITNENHEKYGTEEYIYDVYYRISYFKTQDNYNGYVRSMEYLDRGVYAVPADNGIFVSWRLLATEYGSDIAFDIYRNGELINEEPITDRTNYIDGKAGDVYTVVKIQDGRKYESEAVTALDKNYLSIPLQRPDPQPDVNGDLASYSINDAGVGDVDGDGQYEIIVKWYPDNKFDSGKTSGPSSPTIFDIYEMDGTPLWRLNLGLEMPSGAHFNQFMLYDLDEDGKAELFIKTSDGSVSYKPNAEGKFDMTDESTVVSYIGDKNVVPGSNIIGGNNGHVSANSNEYVTVFNGMTGEVIDTTEYVNKTGALEDWGDDWGNRASRYNISLAYLPKDEGSTETIPAVLFNRGYYAKTTVAAYTLRDGRITLEWNFVAEGGSTYASKGNHNNATGDVDNDGFDELVMGALALDHDGSVLWVKDGEEGRDFAGHADAIHLAAMFPDSDQLYVMTPAENTDSTLNYSVTNAGTGARITGQFQVKDDIGRGIAANITPDPGYEYWAGVPSSEIPDQVPDGAIYNVSGEVVSEEKPFNFSTNWRIFWDGDLLSELSDASNPSVDGGEGTSTIFKYNWETNTMDVQETFEGTKMNNSTKNTPSLSADLLGDWREEMVVRSEDDSELRIYMTNYETDYMIYTLMHDPVYRNCIANQNTAYNQPPQIGFYLGEDNRDEVLAMQLPTAKIAYTTEEPAGVVDEDDDGSGENNNTTGNVPGDNNSTTGNVPGDNSDNGGNSSDDLPAAATGDNSLLGFVVILLAVSAGTAAALIFVRRRAGR